MQLDWNITINSLKESLPQTQFQNWLKPVALLRQDETTITLGVPSRFHEEWLKNNYAGQIKQAIRKQCGSDRQLEFEILVEEENREASRAVPPQAPPPPAPVGRPQLRIVGSPPPAGLSESAKPAPPPYTPNLPVFNHPFFELPFNQLPNQLLGIFAQGAVPFMNPFVIVGGVGMGKTHLLTEVGNAVLRQHPEMRVRFTNGDNFSNEMVRGLRDPNEMAAFKRKYIEETDCLLFDDLHGLRTRPKTQEVLLHIFNELANRGARIAFTTIVTPQKLEGFLEPLKSRILAGVNADIRVPSFEDKVQLLAKMCEVNRIVMDSAPLRQLADQGQKDIRELIGSLLRVHLSARLQNRRIDSTFLVRPEDARDPRQNAIAMPEIMSLVEHNFGVPRSELCSKSRKGATVWARQVAMYLARHYTLLPLDEIGRAFGRDHATVIHAFQKVRDAIEKHPARKYEVDFLKQKLQMRASPPPAPAPETAPPPPQPEFMDELPGIE